jgi:parallel beta-helix repeat protein
MEAGLSNHIWGLIDRHVEDGCKDLDTDTSGEDNSSIAWGAALRFRLFLGATFIKKSKKRILMSLGRFRPCPAVFCAVLLTAFSQVAAAKTLCVNPTGSGGCYSKIQSAVSTASAKDVIMVAAGTYAEDVVIGKPISLIGAGSSQSFIDATNLANGILLDGLSNPGLRDITVAGFTVENALYEGILVLNTTDATILDNQIVNNDKQGPSSSGSACLGQPTYETDEAGDCGGGLHLLGAVGSFVSGNMVSGNAAGILITDESAESHHNLIINNTVTTNPLECGIALASHPPVGSSPPNFAPHHGIDNNTVSGNVVTNNGLNRGGAGVGLFADGQGPSRVSNNVVTGNQLTGNSLPGVTLHTHKGPALGATADNMFGNIIISNTISGNGSDVADSATPGTAGININSGDGGSPVKGTIISLNVISNEDVDIAVNTPAEVDAHLNNLLGGKIGVANVCSLDGAACTGTIDATENYWGCSTGPGGTGCTTTSGANLRFNPWATSTAD